jgi:two-component system OmpR family sensor kinase
VLAGETYDSVAHMLKGSDILRLSTWAVTAGLVFALVAGMLLFHVLTRRLRRLTAVMEAFKHSNFCEPAEVLQRFDDHPIETRQGDEMDCLEATFHAMAERIGQQVQKLQYTDMLRRELVANVSHDLRTPLAALQGYLETLLLKEKQLTPEEQRHYLDIVTRHSERLGKLASELFELATLDSHETQVHPETFSLGALVQDVVQKFQLVAQQKHQRLQAHFAEDLPFVCAARRGLDMPLRMREAEDSGASWCKGLDTAGLRKQGGGSERPGDRPPFLPCPGGERCGGV